MTKDNVVICCHDGLLTRVCDIPEGELRQHVIEFNYEELPPFKQSISVGNGLTYENQTGGQKFCKLEELLNLCQDYP